MRKQWEDPGNIYVPHELNNRKMNEDYVESLEESIRKQGYLPTHPVICYRRLDMPKEVFDGRTDALYICAAGFHRTTAAQNMDLDKIYVEVREGKFEDYLETLNTDNFQFDPSVNTDIGQIWSKADKRNACKQLLLLPKYFKMTNVALGDLWHTAETNVRRWRDEIASSIGEGSLEAPFPLSDEWQAELKGILDSNQREDENGDVVHIRSKKDVNVWDYYHGIRSKVDKKKNLDWGIEVEPYCRSTYNAMPSDLSVKQLTELEQKIDANDPTFLEQCEIVGKKERDRRSAHGQYKKIYGEMRDVYHDYMISQDLIGERMISMQSDDYKKAWSAFGTVVSRNFGNNLLNPLNTTDPRKYKAATKHLQHLKKDIESNAEYVNAFAKKQAASQKRRYDKAVRGLIQAHGEMLSEVKKRYPGIDMQKFCNWIDSDSWWLSFGDTPPVPIELGNDLLDKETGNLNQIKGHYEQQTEYIVRGGEFSVSRFLDKLAAEAEQETNIAQDTDLDGVNADDLFFVRVLWNENGTSRKLTFESDPFGEAIDISEMPELLRKQLLKYLESVSV